MLARLRLAAPQKSPADAPGRPVHRGGPDPVVTPCYAQTWESEGKVSAWTRIFSRVSWRCSIFAAKLGAAAD
jgi:hypothetical protein